MSIIRRRLLDDTYKQTAIGNPINVKSVARMYPKIIINGWTKQKTTTGANLFDIFKISDTENIKNNGDSTLTITTTPSSSGVDTKESLREICPEAVAGKQYTFNAISTGNDKIIYFNGTSQAISFGSTFEMTDEILDGTIGFYASGVSTQAVISSIMLNEGASALKYESYTGNKPSPSPDYPQEIVNAGQYSEETAKYEIVLTIQNDEQNPTNKQKITLASDRPLTKWDRLEKRDGVWGYTNNYITKYINKSFYDISYVGENIVLNNVNPDNNSPFAEAFSSHFRHNGLSIATMTDGEFRLSNSNIYIRSNKFTSVDSFKEWLVGKTILFTYPNISDTFIPLSESEQQALNALHTNYPTTVITNNQDCKMEVTYKNKRFGNILKYNDLINFDKWLLENDKEYRYFDISLKPNTKYKLSMTSNNMYKNYAKEYNDNFAFYIGETKADYVNNTMIGNAGVEDNNMPTEYIFTTSEKPYYFNLYFNPKTKDSLNVVFNELFTSIMLQEVHV